MALNYQTLDVPMQLNLGIFQYNQRTGEPVCYLAGKIFRKGYSVPFQTDDLRLKPTVSQVDLYAVKCVPVPRDTQT